MKFDKDITKIKRVTFFLRHSVDGTCWCWHWHNFLNTWQHLVLNRNGFEWNNHCCRNIDWLFDELLYIVHQDSVWFTVDCWQCCWLLITVYHSRGYCHGHWSVYQHSGLGKERHWVCVDFRCIFSVGHQQWFGCLRFPWSSGTVAFS